MKRALIVAPHFAPINAPDGHRVRLNLPHYRKCGWEVEVLAVRPEHRADWRDDTLLETLPPDVPIHRCGAIPLRWLRLFGMGTMGWRALPFLAAKGSALLARKRFDLVVFSTTQFNVLVLGPLWKTLFGTPFVVDLQDPWLNDYYDRPGAPKPPGGWKYRFAHWQAARLEPFCFRRAAGFSLVSEDYQSLLGDRYAWFAAKPTITLPFAAPVDDFAGPIDETTHCSARVCRCVGALNEAFLTSLNVFFAAAAQARSEAADHSDWRFEFIGTSYAGSGRRSESLALAAAKAHGMDDVTTESTDRVAYRESLKLMREADLLLMLGSDDLRYAPSRLATLCAAGRPVMVVADRESVVLRRAQQVPGVATIGYSCGASEQALAAGAMIFRFDSSLPRPELPESYQPTALASRECALWDKCLSER
jgi:hypothetical protein